MEMRFEGKTRWKVLVYDSNHQQIFNFSSPQTIFFTSKILDDTYFLDPNEDYLFFLQHPLEYEVKSKVIIHSSSQHLKFENHLEVKTKVIDEREMEKEIEIKRGEMEKEIKDKKLRILDVNDSEMKNGVQYLKIPVDTHDTIFIISTNKSMHFKNHTIEISFDGKKQRWKTDIRGEPVSFLEIRGFDHKGELIVTEDLSSIEIDQSYILPFHIITTTKNELMMS
jgi:hypothetical protein